MVTWIARVLAGVSVAAMSGPALAQGLPAPVPSQARDLAPRVTPRLAPGLGAAPAPAAGAAAGAPTVPVMQTSVTGSDAVPAARLELHHANLAGRVVSAEEIEAARTGILAAYRQAGFIFSSVTWRAERVAGGVALRFAVQEGRIARVRLDQDIGPAGTQVLRFLRTAVSEGPATAARLERALLLAGDVPGVTVRGVVRPLEDGQPGELELVAEVMRRPFSGSLTADNRAYRLTGPVQFLLLGQANSFTSLGERTEAAFFTSAGGEALFGQATSEFFVGSSGLRVRLFAGAGRSTPSGQLAAIGYAGDTQVAGAAVSYPIIRRRSVNLFAGAQLDMYDNTVETGTDTKLRASHDAVRAFRAGLDGQHLDTLLSFAPPAVTTASLRLHQGIAGLGATTDASSPGPVRRGSEFGFTKLTGEVQRTQPLWAFSPSVSVGVQALVAGQWSDQILPASEKFFLGGTRIGRGFYLGQVSGDRAVGMALEAQLNVALRGFTLAPAGTGAVEVRPSAQFYMFYDAGRTWENLRTDPDRRMESFGGGVRTAFSDTVFLDIEGVRRITRQVDAGGSAVRPIAANAAFFRLMVRF